MASHTGLIARLIGAVLLACVATAAQAEKRVALVIGNSAYQTVAKLPNSAADARLMSDTLLSLGFFVVGGSAQVDLDKAGFDHALQAFSQELIGADVALFYFAGHGVETHGLNYIVPVDAHPADEGDVFVQGVGLAGVLDRMEKSGAKINLMLLDACRNNPFVGHGLRDAAGGLAQMQAPSGTLISFATRRAVWRSTATTGIAPTRAPWPTPCSTRVMGCSGLSTRWDWRWRRLPTVNSCHGSLRRRSRPVSTSPANLCRRRRCRLR